LVRCAHTRESRCENCWPKGSGVYGRGRAGEVGRIGPIRPMLDYEDFLRQRGLSQWAKDDPRAREVRDVGKTKRRDPTDPTDWTDYAGWMNHADPAIVANGVICLIHQANYLLDRQIAGLEHSFIQEGGYSENLAAARRMERQSQIPIDPVNPVGTSRGPGTPTPACPTCGGSMASRTAHQGKNAGSRFWGCRGYPECRGTRPLEPATEERKSERLDRSVRSDRGAP